MKFGGQGKKKQKCIHRVCTANVAIKTGKTYQGERAGNTQGGEPTGNTQGGEPTGNTQGGEPTGKTQGGEQTPAVFWKGG